MNKDIFEGKFKEISGELKKKWGELTDDEIRKTQGDAEALEGILQQKFGITKEQSAKDVSDMLETLERKYSPQKLSESFSAKVEKMKDKLKKS